MQTTIRNILFGALLAIGLGVPYLHAADVAISALPAGSALAGTEPIPMVQSAATKKTTPAAIKTYVETSPFYLGASAYLYSGTANVIEQRNSTTAQTLQVFDTYTDSSNYARIALNTSLTGDWVQVAAQTAGTAGDNYGIALTPTGTGAISAQVPDSTAAGGNARGAGAVDWQTTRADSTMVASAASSVISGGNGNTASGADSVVSGGGLNTASGANSWIPGGVGADTHSVQRSFAYGGPFGQTYGVTLGVTSTDDVAATLTSVTANSGPTFNLRIVSGYVAACTGVFAASDATAAAGFECNGVAKNIGGTTTLVTGACAAIGTPDSALSTATMAMQANDTDDTLEVTFTGINETVVNVGGELKCSTTFIPD